MSGRIGALKTFGRGWVASLALPSAEMMVTVGRVVILSAVVVCRVSSCKSSQNPKLEVGDGAFRKPHCGRKLFRGSAGLGDITPLMCDASTHVDIGDHYYLSIRMSYFMCRNIICSSFFQNGFRTVALS